MFCCDTASARRIWEHRVEADQIVGGEGRVFCVAKGLIEGLLPPGFITVGYEVHIRHKAAAAMGSQVKSWCKLLEVDGRKLLFEVRVTQGEKVIGEGQHRRTIIHY